MSKPTEMSTKTTRDEPAQTSFQLAKAAKKTATQLAPVFFPNTLRRQGWRNSQNSASALMLRHHLLRQKVVPKPALKQKKQLQVSNPIFTHFIYPFWPPRGGEKCSKLNHGANTIWPAPNITMCPRVQITPTSVKEPKNRSKVLN